MITMDELVNLTKTYHLKPLDEVSNEELMSDAMKLMLEIAGRGSHGQELAGTAIVLWAAFGKPFVELRHRPKAEDKYDLLCQMDKDEPLVANTLINFTDKFGVYTGEALAAFILMFYAARKEM